MTTISNIFTINGVIDTSKPVMENMNVLASACSSWVTFDIHEGKWSVVVNEPGDSIASFNDSNIIGSIVVSGTSLSDLYNKVEFQFPHKDLNDEVDTITYEIPSENRFPYEYDNILNFQLDCINDPVQAELLAAIQLKQNRVDKVVQFRTDFTKLGLKAGDIIDITNTPYGFSAKKFRVLTISEEDSNDHGIIINITAFEYDSDVYNTSGLVRTQRTTANGIISDCVNDAIATSQTEADTASFLKLLGPLALASMFNGLFPGILKSLMSALANPACTINGPSDICEGDTATVSASICNGGCSDLQDVELDYEISGIDSSVTTRALKGKIKCNSTGTATLTIPTIDGSIDSDRTMKVTINKKEKEIVIHDRKTYSITANPNTITEGGSSTVTISTVGIPNGTTLPYTISGSGIDQLSGTATSSNVIINNNTATIEVTTKDIDALVDTQLVITLGSAGNYYCSSVPGTISISKTGTPPTPPPPDTTCDWVDIPVAWCGQYDGTTGVIKGLEVLKTASVLKALSGGPSVTVPLTATVTGGNIVVTQTITVDSSTNKGGTLFSVITNFNPPEAGVKKITGTTTQLIGY